MLQKEPLLQAHEPVITGQLFHSYDMQSSHAVITTLHKSNRDQQELAKSSYLLGCLTKHGKSKSLAQTYELV